MAFWMENEILKLFKSAITDASFVSTHIKNPSPKSQIDKMTADLLWSDSIKLTLAINHPFHPFQIDKHRKGSVVWGLVLASASFVNVIVLIRGGGRTQFCLFLLQLHN